MGGLLSLYSAIQIPGVETVDQTMSERIIYVWDNMAIMQYPLLICVILGVIVIIWKFFDLMGKGSATRKTLREVEGLLADRRLREAMDVTANSNSPAARILHAGLERHEEGTDRVMKAIENQGLIELSKLESGLVILATLTNIAPLLGFLGTVIGMIVAFQSIEAAGEVEATLVAGGIKIALMTTAAGLVIAIPVSIAHNFFVSRIDSLVIDMEESAQKMVDAIGSMAA